MRPFIELLINDELVEFKEPPTILFTYAHTDLHNPTVVKNSFSKTITVDGTPRNNRIFGCFGNMNRVLEYADGKYTGAHFNPSRKIDFVLLRNGEPIERGYVKLDKVVKNGNQLKYELTLYGGLGQFLYNLQYKDDGEQMKLSDLDYGSGEKEFDVEVNAKNVLYAWNRINGKNGEWQNDEYKIFDKINFAPCYNGIPKDFSADKVAIDVQSFITADDTDLSNQFVTEKDGYTTIDGWVMGELAKEYNEWEMNDLRSYMQRPVMRFKEIIQGCCRPENNGGYTVDLDGDFFSADNPYYEDAWMTLPLVTEIESENESEISVINNNWKFYVEGGNEGDLIKVKMNITPAITSSANTSTIKTGTIWYKITYDDYGNIIGYTRIAQNIGRFIQLVVRDKNGKVIGGSAGQVFTTNIDGCNTFNFVSAYDAPKTYNYGTYQRIDEENTFAFEKGIYEFEASVVYQEGMYFEIYQSYSDTPAFGDDKYDGMMFDDKGNGVSDFTYGYGTHTAEAKLVKKKWMITKKTLLNSEKTPCDYFLSYLKTFNLHIWKDMYDKVIYVRTRKNFFNGEVKDLEDSVDRGDSITITPLTFENKWLCFKAEYETDEKLHKDYVDEYGLDFGIQKVDTNYSFDSSSKDILENYVFKGCITTRNKSKYYTDLHIYETEDIQYPPFMLDGCKTYLFKGGDTTEASYITPKTTAEAKQLWSEKYYDLMPKPNFTDKSNGNVEGANVLLFYNGKQEVKNNDGEWIFVNITDDITQFETLNDGEPCWIWSYDTAVVKRPDYLPMFGRYITNENGWITHSWDFGTPKAIYVPDYKIDQSSSIYSKYWQSYMRDQYDSNTRVVECKVWFKAKVNPDMLQTFVYFDGCHWLIKEITDYDVTSQRPTKVKMIKVNDINNYMS